MRLLNTVTYEVEDFFGRKIPPYSILSHRWGADEVSLKDYRKGRKCHGPGYNKIIAGCDFVRHYGHQYLWIDTCCIDRTSSAELTESINSMFSWYLEATVCFVHLSDVRSLRTHTREEILDDFRKSEWFTRGWTLQELIAPSIVIFCTSSWEVIGSKKKLRPDEPCEVLWPIIHAITGIHEELLQYNGNYVGFYSAAQRMSWVADRKTTKPEDLAYCLLGIFGANISLLYGEGIVKAFRRLLEEILRSENDESLLAWSPSPRDEDPYMTIGLFSWHPGSYKRAGNVQHYHTFTNARLTLENGEIVAFRLSTDRDQVFVLDVDEKTQFLAISLRCYGCIDEHYGNACPQSSGAGSLGETRIIVKQMGCGHWGRVHNHPFHDDLCPGSNQAPDYISSWKLLKDRDITLYFHAMEFSWRRCDIADELPRPLTVPNDRIE